MRKFSLFMTAVVAISLMAMAFASQPRSASAAQKEIRVGLVIEYIPSQSITIEDMHGNQSTFELAPNLKFVPPHRADLLAAGAYVTIIAPDKTLAIGIVIHPQPPAAFSKKASTQETPSPVESPTEKPPVTETPTPLETATETATPTGTLITESPTPTATQTVKPLSQSSPPPVVTSFMEWLASLFRQVLTTGS